MTNRKKYGSLLLVAASLIVLAITVFGETILLGPILITVGVYIGFGVIVRWCKESERFKNTLIEAIEYFFKSS